MTGSTKSVLRRLGRSALSILITGALAIYANDPRFLALAPFIQAGAKWLRNRFKLKNVPL